MLNKPIVCIEKKGISRWWDPVSYGLIPIGGMVFFMIYAPDLFLRNTALILLSVLMAVGFFFNQVGSFTVIEIFEEGLFIKRFLKKPLLISLDRVNEIHSWQIRGKYVRHKLKIRFKDISKKQLEIGHHFYDKELAPLFIELTERGVTVIQHPEL